MVTCLSRQGGRRYKQFGATLALVSTLSSVGSPPASGSPTTNKRRYPQFNRTLALVKSLDSLGNASGGGGGSTAGFSRAQAVNNTMEPLKQSTSRNLMIFMVSSSDHVTGASGLSLTITVSKDGAAFGTITPTVADLGNGWYNIVLSTTHTNTLGDLAFHITGSGADPGDFKLPVELDRTGATVSAVTGNVGGSVASIAGVTFPTNFAVLSIDTNGRIKPLTGLTKNVAFNGFMFLMTDSGTHAPKTGLGSGVTGTVSIDAAAFVSLTNTVSEVSGGYYKINLASADLNGNSIAFRFTGASADDTDISVVTSA